MNTETGWLIETIALPLLYWIGAPYSGRYKGIDTWTTNSCVAIRFCRKQDAEWVMTMQGIPVSEFRCSEHQWG